VAEEAEVEFGQVVDLTLGEPAGTELVADAAIGATTLSVDYAGEFEDSGDLTLNGEVIAYTSIAFGETETDPDVITLATPLATAATTDDKVGLVSGGEQVTEWQLHVSLGDGHPVDIPIPYEQRAMWSKVDVSTPVPVVVSADLERLVEVPGRPPILDQSYIGIPYINLYLPANQTVSSSGTTYATLTNWTVRSSAESDLFVVNTSTGEVTLNEDGFYGFFPISAWVGNSSGRRYIRLVTNYGGVDEILRTIPGSPPDATTYSQQIGMGWPILAGTKVRVEVLQDSGASLDVRGGVGGLLTQLQIVRWQA
jgi:hypothetical protein